MPASARSARIWRCCRRLSAGDYQRRLSAGAQSSADPAIPAAEPVADLVRIYRLCCLLDLPARQRLYRGRARPGRQPDRARADRPRPLHDPAQPKTASCGTGSTRGGSAIGILVPPDDMIHVKNLSVDGYVGVSPIAIAQDVIGLALATQQHGGILFRQGGQIGGVLQHPGKLVRKPPTASPIHGARPMPGVQNAHKVAILEEGMTFEKIAMTNEDSQFLETRQFQVIDICRLYGVPPHAWATRQSHAQQHRAATARLCRRLPRPAHLAARRPDG